MVCIIPCSRAVTKIFNCACVYARIIISKRWIKQVKFSFSSIFPMFPMIVMACSVLLGVGFGVLMEIKACCCYYRH